MNVRMNLFMKGDLLNVTNEPKPTWLILAPQLHIIVGRTVNLERTKSSVTNRKWNGK